MAQNKIRPGPTQAAPANCTGANPRPVTKPAAAASPYRPAAAPPMENLRKPTGCAKPANFASVLCAAEELQPNKGKRPFARKGKDAREH
jgi:hypothetical protein